MIVVSLNRNETSAELQKDSVAFAAAFGGDVLVIPFLYDIPANHELVKQLQALPETVYHVPLAVRAARSLLTYLKIPFAEVVSRFGTANNELHAESNNQENESPQFPKRWYPVIDESRCVGCLECVNFCLFGVYAVGKDDKPFVDQPDACRDGCPACSRVCPGKAIIFPMCEERAIAGYDDEPAAEQESLVDLVDSL